MLGQSRASFILYRKHCFPVLLIIFEAQNILKETIWKTEHVIQQGKQKGLDIQDKNYKIKGVQLMPMKHRISSLKDY